MRRQQLRPGPRSWNDRRRPKITEEEEEEEEDRVDQIWAEERARAKATERPRAQQSGAGQPRFFWGGDPFFMFLNSVAPKPLRGKDVA